MRDLMKTNIYDIEDTIIIVGSCLQNMQPNGYEKLKELFLHQLTNHYIVYNYIIFKKS